MAIFSGQRQWVYPLKIKGRFSGYHRFSSAVLFAILAFVPWIRIGGHPVFLADVPDRRLYVLGQIFTASDGVLIMIGALTAAFALFFFTTLYGRLWCGYACPQSVFMINLVFPIEEWLEGARATRMKRNKGPWTFDKAWRKVAKWFIYAAFAVLLSMSFMGFFVEAKELWTLQAGGTAYAIVAFFSAIWFFDFAWYREQVCNYICPYARFQGALTDDQSLVISYDVPRGEPRGKAARQRGGCIDCNKCVVVCPQGIDIRDGYQLECIACGKCVDACTSVMDRLGHDTLVRYSTDAQDHGKPARGFLRARTIAYGSILSVLTVAAVSVLLLRSPVEVLVDRAPGSLFIEDADGMIRNTYLVHLTNRTTDEEIQTWALAVEGLPEHAEVQSRPVQIATNERKTVPLIVRIPRESASRTLPLTVKVRGAEVEVSHPMTFKGPGRDGE